jgi:hypothetical protein
MRPSGILLSVLLLRLSAVAPASVPVLFASHQGPLARTSNYEVELDLVSH